MPSSTPKRSSAAWVASSSAWETSVSLLPGTIALRPSASTHSVAQLRASTSGANSPMPNDQALSPTQPSRVAPQSMETKSPSSSTMLFDGIPCTTTSFTDAQIEPVKPW